LAQLRLEADNAVGRAEEAEAKNKKLEQEILNKDQEIQSLSRRLAVAETELEKAEGKLTDAKHVHDEHESSKTTNEGLQRKILLLEEELDSAEKNLKETVERCVRAADRAAPPHISRFSCGVSIRLRQMDLKAEHFERQVHTLERERDQWEKKYEVCQYNPISNYFLTFYHSTGNPREVSGFQERARRACRQHGRVVITLRSFFSHMYVQHRAGDDYRTYLTLSVAVLLIRYTRQTLVTLAAIRFMYLTVFSVGASIISINSTPPPRLLSVEFKGY